LLAGCVSTTPVAVSDAPIAVEKGSFYRSVKSSASYGNGVLLVRGEFTLVRSMSLPPHYVRIQVFGADDKLLAEVPAKLVREGKHRPGDPRLEVSFNTGIQIPLAQVVRIEVRYNSPS
jgi:hypothetical protein